jgi:hypothetical protein
MGNDWPKPKIENGESVEGKDKWVSRHDLDSKKHFLVIGDKLLPINEKRIEGDETVVRFGANEVRRLIGDGEDSKIQLRELD